MIVTFYSYKGGVGRSMAMANVADILARRGLKVLMIDFDLEAPGLEQFFQINVEGVRRHVGLLDLLLAYKQSMSVGGGEQSFRRVGGFVCPVYERLPGGGRLDILPAGQRQEPEQLARYALNLRTFDWQDFYYNWEGELFFEWLRRALVAEGYDLVLVDSRTGVTEMGGICGYQLADAIVMLCAANHQNLNGTANMVRDFRSANVEALRHGRALDLVVVPARVEQHDPELLEAFYERFEAAFAGLLPERLKQAGISFRGLTIPYEPQYAFEEQVVSDPARAAERKPIGAVFEALADIVCLLAPEGSPLARVGQPPQERTVLYKPEATAPGPAASAPEDAAAQAPPAAARYDPAKRFADYDVFFDYSHQDEEVASVLARGLAARGVHAFFDRDEIAPGEQWRAVIEEALFHSRVLVFCVGAAPLSDWRRYALQKALESRERGRPIAIVPVLLPKADEGTVRASALADFAWLDLREDGPEVAIERLHRAVMGTLQDAPRVEAEARAPYVGQQAFAEHQADLFFGRESVVEALLKETESASAIVIAGPSGCGKSSVVRAGLVPRLRAAREPWVIVAVQAGSRPLSALSAALEPLAAGTAGATVIAGTAAAAVGGQIDRAMAANPDARILVFLDDFESALHPRADARELQNLVAAMREAIERHGRRVLPVIALRSDFKGRLQEVVGPLWFGLPTVLDMPPMKPDELRMAVQGAAERAGLAFEPGLADRLVAEAGSEPGVLPFVQKVLRLLWENQRSGWLTNASYESFGGLRGFIVARAEEIYAAWPEAHRAAMRGVMLRLVRPGRGQEAARRRALRRELVPQARPGEAPSGSLVEETLDALIDARLLVACDEGGQAAVEPAHEVLVRGWERMRGWLNEEREFLAWRERLAAPLSDWRAADKSEALLLRGAALDAADAMAARRSEDLSADELAYIRASGAARDALIATAERRRRWMLRGATGAATLFLGLAVLAGIKWQDAEHARAVTEEALAYARAEQQRAEANARSAQSQFDAAERQRQAAERTVAELKGNVETLRKVAEEASQARQIDAARRAEAEAAARNLQATLKNFQQKVDSSRAQA
ncbi:MAG TPA: TIR domain-containing protein, partial [Rhodocyclaceae bacterium]|nr:TIR domain-containing protein [Rhodocyclaceae bacterium]